MDNQQGKRIGVLTSGGDAPGMNGVIRAVTRTSINSGVQVMGIRRGYHGLYKGRSRRTERSFRIRQIESGRNFPQHGTKRALYDGRRAGASSKDDKSLRLGRRCCLWR
jgi:hypothetical protein